MDDEPAVCAAVKETLEDSRIPVQCFTHPADCLPQLRRGRCDVLITDLKMSEKNGMELLKEVRDVAPWIPVLIVTGYGDVPTAVKAIKAGAVDFIEKPLGKDGFVHKVKLLLERSRTIPMSGFRALTMMEMKVFRMVVKGKSNTEIAEAIHRSVRTVESHRGRLMGKLGVHNLVELSKVVAALGLVDLPVKPGAIQDALEIDERLNGTLGPG